MKETLSDRLEKKDITIEDAISALKLARSRIDLSELRFIRDAMALEDSGLWLECRTSADVTFGHFLNRMQVCSAERYDRRVKALRSRDIVECIATIGIDAAAYVAEVTDDDARARTMECMLEAAKNRGGPVPDRTARNIRDATGGGKLRVSKDVLAVAKIQELERMLAAKNREIARLEKEMQALRERLGEAEVCEAENQHVTGKRMKAKSDRSQPIA